MLDYFKTTKGWIIQAVEAALEDFGREYDGISPELGLDAARRLVEFTGRGKMIRGCLVRLGYELASGRQADLETGDPVARAVLQAAAAMELFQSGLLVHDDIMDRDRLRRGAPTLHVGYESSLEAAAATDPHHYGEALGICAGDLAYFAAFRLLAELPVGDPAARRVCAIAARELAWVGVAQMQDVANGAKRTMADTPASASDAPASLLGPADAIDEAAVLRLYRYKTGRYTFSLPMALGAAIAESIDATRQAMEKAGEYLGILFQLKDDELGLYADEADLGKPIGADIREDKKTLFRLRLFQQANADSLARIKALFGSDTLSQEDLAWVRDLVEMLGIRDGIKAMMADQADQAQSLLKPLVQTAPPQTARALEELLRYSLERVS